MYIKTVHGTFLAWSSDGEIVHGDFRDLQSDSLVRSTDDGSAVVDPSGFVVAAISPFDHGVAITANGKYFAAQPDIPAIAKDRAAPGYWECYYLVQSEQADSASMFNRSPEGELVRFRARVEQLIADGQPVLVNCGCGHDPKPGFLNLDIVVSDIPYSLKNPDQYFIFPYVDGKWPVEDGTIDYICHEDFIEHVSQLQQIQFLAETLRVLKPGCYHRVNTPNIIASMERHSDFKRGFEGVYTGELEWGHICMFSPSSLREIATLVGYSEVAFKAKSDGASPYAVPEIRPGWDRDELVGNVIADLLK